MEPTKQHLLLNPAKIPRAFLLAERRVMYSLLLYLLQLSLNVADTVISSQK